MRRIPLTLTLAAAVLLAIFHALGTYFYIYWREPGFDWVVHMLGGFFVTSVLLGIFYSKSTLLNRWLVLLIVAGVVLLIGIAWEFFEVNTGAALMNFRGYWPNTAGDILFDIIGGCTAIAYAYVPKPESKS